MSRYIDAEALLKDLKEELEIDSPMLNEVENKWIDKGIRIAIKDVKRFPTADVVEVVRCRDCKYSEIDENGNTWCTFYNGKIREMPNGYCWHGERRENET